MTAPIIILRHKSNQTKVKHKIYKTKTDELNCLTFNLIMYRLLIFVPTYYQWTEL